VDVSVVIPIYNEAEGLRELVRRVREALDPTGKSWELILVDDGSRDGSDRLIEQLAAEEPRLKPLWLIRNYGQSAALQAGFDAASGGIVVTLDGDLQNDPTDIPGLLQLFAERPDIDMISGWRKSRQDALVRRKLPSRAANWLISKVTGVRLHDYGCALKAYRADTVGRLRLYGEMHRFIPALAAEAGAHILEVPVNHHPRAYGKSKYGLDRAVRVLLDLMLTKFLMRYLHRPLHVFGGAGLAMGAAGGLILAWLLVEKLRGFDIGGRPLLTFGMLLVVVGVQFLVLGILGELLVRIYHEPQGRPHYHTRERPRDRR
jgi:glycosyltransferase involved in cell wall biosynthesis